MAHLGAMNQLGAATTTVALPTQALASTLLQAAQGAVSELVSTSSTVASIFCKTCGTRFAGDAAFCESCGGALRTA